MTLDQIEHVLTELGWCGKPGHGPQVHLNGGVTFGRMWIEKGLVVFEDKVINSKTWLDPNEVTRITPTGFDDSPALRVVK